MKTLKYMIFLFLTVGFVSCRNQDKKEKTTTHASLHYTCPMHPQIMEDKPGNCPICNMDLVPVKTQKMDMGLTLNDTQIQLGNIRTLKIGAQNFSDSKLLNAVLVPNPENTQVISSKFAGRVDQLYEQETGVKVNKGQALFRIYSEELLSLQKDYLLNIKQSEAFPKETIYQKLVKAAAQKLSLYGYSSHQIAQLGKSGGMDAHITVYAPEGGLITEVNLTEGQYVMEGSPLFKIENLNQLWVEADLYPSERKDAQLGKKISVRVNGFENEPIESRISFINPQLNGNSQILKVRAEISNPKQQFQPGMQASISFPYQGGDEVISIPNDAVMREENGDIVWVKTNKGHYEFRMVTLGAENENSVVVTKGLKNGDEIVISGAYLLSSEYTLKKGSDFMAGMNM
jgi:Cu(I)/Ag(I) efflux system membrane fusion protein